MFVSMVALSLARPKQYGQGYELEQHPIPVSKFSTLISPTMSFMRSKSMVVSKLKADSRQLLTARRITLELRRGDERIGRNWVHISIEFINPIKQITLLPQEKSAHNPHHS